VEKSFTASSTAQLPSVTTTGVSGVKSTSAVLSGYLSSLGSASTVYLSFEWGTTPGALQQQNHNKSQAQCRLFHRKPDGIERRNDLLLQGQGGRRWHSVRRGAELRPRLDNQGKEFEKIDIP